LTELILPKQNGLHPFQTVVLGKCIDDIEGNTNADLLTVDTYGDRPAGCDILQNRNR